MNTQTLGLAAAAAGALLAGEALGQYSLPLTGGQEIGLNSGQNTKNAIGDPGDLSQLGVAYDSAVNSSMRGPAAGADADAYDWRHVKHARRTSKDEANMSTLELLRNARDYNALPFFQTNALGLDGEWNSNGLTWDVVPGSRSPYDTDQQKDDYFASGRTTNYGSTLAEAAADWVYYTNVVLQQYDNSMFQNLSSNPTRYYPLTSASGPITSDQRALDILNSLSHAQQQDASYTYGWLYRGWWNDTNYTRKDLLPDPGETVPTVTHWEIGNEADIGNLPNYFSGRDAYRTSGFYKNNYAAITQAMLAVDPTIKVGPSVYRGNSYSNNVNPLMEVLNDHNLQVDFVAYHPYEGSSSTLGYNILSKNTTATMDSIRGLYNLHTNYLNNIKNKVTASGRNANEIEYWASEWHALGFAYQESSAADDFAHALGAFETVMSFNRLGVKGAHFWDRPHLSPSAAKAMEMIGLYQGDTLLDYAVNDSSGNEYAKCYVTMDEDSDQLTVWLVNWHFDQSATINFGLNGLPQNGTIKHVSLKAGDDDALWTNTFDYYERDVTNNPIFADVTDIEYSIGRGSIVALVFEGFGLNTPAPAPPMMTSSWGPAIPEPASFGLLALGLGLIGFRRRA